MTNNKRKKLVSWDEAKKAAGALGKKFWQSEMDKMNRELAKGKEFAAAFRAGPRGTKEQKKLIDNFMMNQVKVVGGIKDVGGVGPWTDAYIRPMTSVHDSTSMGSSWNEGIIDAGLKAGKIKGVSYPRLTPSQQKAVSKVIKEAKLDALKKLFKVLKGS